jgi:hypothetical protein
MDSCCQEPVLEGDKLICRWKLNNLQLENLMDLLENE